MAKRLKMVIYGEPGVGKSVFASKAPKPFFITTDGNYEWLEDFGAKMEDHIQVHSWEQAKKAFAQSFDGYETIVVDLTEDLFKWCEQEYCKRNRFEHISDIGYGKGYDITRNEFFLELCKLVGLDKHIIFIMHGVTFVVKDRRGVEHAKYGPTNRIPDKVLDMIEGRVRYFLRAYLASEEQADGSILKKRYLSIVPKENEFGIARGLDENLVPHDIPLDFTMFANVIGLNTQSTQMSNVETVEKKEETNQESEVQEDNQEVSHRRKRRTKAQIEEDNRRWAEENAAKDDTSNEVKDEVRSDESLKSEETHQVSIDEVNDTLPWEEPSQPKVEEKPVETKPEPQPETAPVQPKVESQTDKIAAIKAKLARINATKK